MKIAIYGFVTTVYLYNYLILDISQHHLFYLEQEVSRLVCGSYLGGTNVGSPNRQS